MKIRLLTVLAIFMISSCNENQEIAENENLFDLDASLLAVEDIIENELDIDDLDYSSGRVEEDYAAYADFSSTELNNEVKNYMEILNEELSQTYSLDDALELVISRLSQFDQTEISSVSDYQIVFSLLVYHSAIKYMDENRDLFRGRVEGRGAAVAVGVVVGGAIGALLGAAVGTLVAPGPGTVIAGVTGYEAGAALGAVLGAGAGAIGGYVGWFD